MSNRNSITMPDFISLINENFKKDQISVIFEVGALDAKDALLFKNEFPAANVFAVEGLVDNFNNYMKKLKIITPINAIICDKDGTVDYYKKIINGIHGIFNRGDEYPGEIIRDVPCCTLKTLCKEYDVEIIDVIKIDVEGATFEVLKGMGDLLSTIKIMHIETETIQYFKGQKLHEEVIKFLEDNNFSMIDFTSCPIGSGTQCDSVWINNMWK